MGRFCYSGGDALFHDFQHLFCRFDLYLFESTDLKLIVIIFLNLEHFLVIEQIEQLITIYLVETHSEVRLINSILRSSQLEQIVNA